MTRYKNLNGTSSVCRYDIQDTYIDVMFQKEQRVYRYSYKKPGIRKVEEMKRLAKRGCGLNSYIVKSIGRNYEKKYLI